MKRDKCSGISEDRVLREDNVSHCSRVGHRRINKPNLTTYVEHPAKIFRERSACVIDRKSTNFRKNPEGPELAKRVAK
ncbi:hypothetical protein TNCV_4479991 [Trichonephila clavipes]|nr:hypothetical protein TNCV_4479991 [Trichonephila clavipes]